MAWAQILALPRPSCGAMGELFPCFHCGHLWIQHCPPDFARLTLVNMGEIFEIVPDIILFCLFLILFLNLFCLPCPLLLLLLTIKCGSGVILSLFLVSFKYGYWISAENVSVQGLILGGGPSAFPQLHFMWPSQERSLMNLPHADLHPGSAFWGRHHMTFATAILPPIMMVEITRIWLFTMSWTLW